MTSKKNVVFFIFILAFDIVSVLRGHSVFSSPPQRLRRISIPDFIRYIVVLSLFFRKSQYFPS